MWPPKPKFTEKDLPDLHGKVYIVTGSNTGVGKELARMLYSANAKVYIATRSEERALKAIEDIKVAVPTSTGALVFLSLDLGDLTTIKASAEKFLAAEEKLHVLWNNAGVMIIDDGKTKTAQGYEQHIGINNVGTFLFTKLLTPVLVKTAKEEPANTVRVVWVASSGTEMLAVENIGLPLDNLDYHVEKPAMVRYGLSKVGNWAHGVEFARRHKDDGIISIPLNPGNLSSDLYRQHSFFFKLLIKMIVYEPVYGAYTELFAGLSPEVKIEKTGDWVIPWGRFYPIRKDLLNAVKSEKEGGTGGAYKFWEWTEEQVKAYL